MNKIQIQQQIINQMELVEELSIEFEAAKKRLLAAKAELNRLRQLVSSSSN